MTIEDRVRRVLHDAVADEPQLRGVPLQIVIRRRRRRPLLAGAVALVLVLAAVVGLAAVRGRQRPLPSSDPTSGWTVYTDTVRNLQLRYPPGWVLRERQPGWLRIAPPEHAAGVLEDQPPFAVGVRAPAAGYYLGEQTGVDLIKRRLPSGPAYVVSETDPAAFAPPPDVSATSRPLSELPRQKTYAIDWGRGCTASGARPRCGTRVVMAGVMAANTPLWDRYRATGEAIVATIAPARPVASSSGDRTRPACRPNQWRLFHPGGWSYGDLAQRYVLEGGFEFLGGQPCHLRLALRLEVEKPAGRRLSLPGNPSTLVVEGDLPEDAQVVNPNGDSIQGTPLNWYWAWQEWCNTGLPQASLRISPENGAPITVPGPPLADPPDEPDTGCRDRGRPSTIAPWP
jgi:hypothetical protein